MAYHPNLDPELRAVLDRTPLPAVDLSTMAMEDVAGIRAEFHAVAEAMPRPDNGVTIEDRHVPGPAGAPDVRLRVHRPAAGPAAGPEAGPEEARPCLYWIHGGGMMVGTPEMDDAFLAEYVERLGCVVVAVDYRLAPEHPDPAPVEDCYAGLVWTAGSAAELGVDPARLAVGGASAGGGLAAGTVLLARDRGGPAVAFQLLLGPMLDDRNVTPSSHEFADAVLWNRDANLFGWRALLGDRAGGDDVSPYAAPARARDLSGLPPAFVDVGELEVFRDEDVDYAMRLVRAGVSTELHLYPGAFHGFDMVAPDTELGVRARQARIAALSRALRR